MRSKESGVRIQEAEGKGHRVRGANVAPTFLDIMQSRFLFEYMVAHFFLSAPLSVNISVSEHSQTISFMSGR